LNLKSYVYEHFLSRCFYIVKTALSRKLIYIRGKYLVIIVLIVEAIQRARESEAVTIWLRLS